MSNILNVPLSNGYVSTGDEAKSAYDLGPGELVQMKGAFYRKNDSSQPWRIPGRSLFGTAGEGSVRGLAICQFDAGGTDRLLAMLTSKIVSAVPGTGASFTDLITGLNPLATRLTACHQDDRWYLGNGYDANRTLMPAGTVRLMGMQAPVLAPTLSSSSTANTITRPTVAVVGGAWVNTANAYDADTATFASETHGSGFFTDWKTWGANATAGRTLRISWGASILGGGASYILLYKSEDGGDNWTQILYRAYSSAQEVAQGWLDISVSADSSFVQFRAATVTLTGSTFRIYDVRIEVGSSANVTTTDGIYYAVTEYYAPDDLESPPSPLSSLLTLSSKSQVTITRPTAINASATHWRVYRIGDGVAATKENLGRVSGDIAISDTAWSDDLSVAITEQALPLIEQVVVGDLSFYRDAPAPPFISMVSWKGSICGISRVTRRSWYYSEGGRPESFPEIYVVESFPLDEHDGLIGQMAVGETMVLLCQGACLAVDDLARVTDGSFTAATARPIKGHPGCVGEYAYTTFSVAGEPRGAWVSPYGVYVTNGTICACISTDLAWESEVNPSYLTNAVLRWDAKNLILWFQFDSDGDGLNDREMPFHMAQAHSKGEAKPKLGQPTPKRTSCMASALLGTTSYRFSGHPSDGKVYLEEVGTVDAATGEAVATTIETAKITNNKVSMAILRATLIHSDFGIGETARLTTKMYRDSSRTVSEKTRMVPVYGDRGTTVGVGRAGEAVQFKIEYDGSGTGGFLGIQAELDSQGRAGSAGRWVASSATP